MKDYCRTINRGLYIAVGVLCGLYLLLIIASFAWYYQYLGVNPQLLFETSIYFKMQLYISFLILTAVLVFITSIGVILSTHLGTKRKLYIISHGKADYFQASLVHTIGLALTSSCLILGVYIVYMLFNGLESSNFETMFTYYVHLRPMLICLYLLTLTTCQVGIVYLILSVRDRLKYTIDKYRQAGTIRRSVLGYMFKMVIVLLIIIGFGLIQLVTPGDSGEVGELLSYQFVYSQTSVLLAICGLSIMIVCDYYHYYQAKVIG